MKPTSEQIIGKIADLLDPLMNSRGYQRWGFRWILPGRWPRLVDIEVFPKATPTSAMFAVNLGVSIPKLHQALEGQEISDELQGQDCDLLTRIGSLLPGLPDEWWHVSPSDDPLVIAQEILSDLKSSGFPWLDKLDDYHSVAQELSRRHHPLSAAVAYRFAGDLTASAAALARSYIGSSERDQATIARIARANEIPLPVA